MTAPLRNWCARCRYDGRDEFMFGTVQAEGEMDALAKLGEAWAEISPHPPPSFVPLPGLLAFREE